MKTRQSPSKRPELRRAPPPIRHKAVKRAPRSQTLRPVIRMAGKDCAGAVKLFEQHDADELVRPGGLAEGEPQLAALDQRRRQTVGAADDEARSRARGGAPF